MCCCNYSRLARGGRGPVSCALCRIKLERHQVPSDRRGPEAGRFSIAILGWLGLKNGSGHPPTRPGHSPPGARGLERSRRHATPARRFPTRLSQWRYGDRAVVVPRDAVVDQEHPAASRRPNPPDLAPVGPHDSAVISRSEGRRPQGVISRSFLDHPVAIHVAWAAALRAGRRRSSRQGRTPRALISRPDSSDPTFVGARQVAGPVRGSVRRRPKVSKTWPEGRGEEVGRRPALSRCGSPRRCRMMEDHRPRRRPDPTNPAG